MQADRAWVSETIEFETPDGVRLAGDLAVPSTPAGGSIERAAIVCHPHPQYGGNRLDHVVDACWRALVDAGFAAFRFDFRPEYGLGESERIDAAAALDLLERRFPGARLATVGYSFGAMVLLGLDDPRPSARVLIAPPLTRMPTDRAGTAATFVLAPAHDQFTPPDAVREVVERWAVVDPAATMEVVEMADHFLHGRAGHVADRTVDWLRRR